MINPNENSSTNNASPGPKPSDQQANLSVLLVEMWTQVINKSSGQWFTTLDELQISLTNCKTLHLLSTHGGSQSVKELAEAVGLSLPGMSRSIDPLVQKGFVSRQEDSHDRRAKQIEITEAGRWVLQRFYESRVEGLDEFVESLDANQYKTIKESVQTIIHTIKRINS